MHRQVECFGAADHGRNPELAGDDGGMGRTPALARHDERGQLHQRFPVGGRHLGDQHISLLEHALRLGNLLRLDAIREPVLHRPAPLQHLFVVLVEPDLAGTDALADRLPGREHLAAVLQADDQFRRHHVTLEFRLAVGRVHGLRPRLHDVELAADAVLGPLDVHRDPVMLLDAERHLRQMAAFEGLERPRPALLEGNLVDARVLHTVVGIHHAPVLAAQMAMDHGEVAPPQTLLPDGEGVRADAPLNHQFTKPVGGGDVDDAAVAGVGVDGEHHA